MHFFGDHASGLGLFLRIRLHEIEEVGPVFDIKGFAGFGILPDKGKGPFFRLFIHFVIPFAGGQSPFFPLFTFFSLNGHDQP